MTPLLWMLLGAGIAGLAGLAWFLWYFIFNPIVK